MTEQPYGCRQRSAVGSYLSCAMRSALLPLALVCTLLVHAQNWALLNPAYRYNYSNDGTDTISNQIRVMHIDTLGVDSFRYELNLIGVVCDTCTAPGLYLLLNQPQFMQRKVDVGPSVWHFHDPGSMVILPQAGLGESWVYDTLAGISATVTVEDVTQVFGSDEQRKVISLSNGDSIVISETNGVLRWNDHELIGVHGPDVGSLIPSLEEIFPYQAGDVLEYQVREGGYDGINAYAGSTRVYKFTVDTGTLFSTGIAYSGQYIEHSWEWADTSFDPEQTFSHLTTTGSSWMAGAPEFPWSELQVSYPGQLVRGRVHESIWLPPDTAICIAKHWLNAAGDHMIGCEPIPDPGGTEEWPLTFRLLEPSTLMDELVLVAPVGYYVAGIPDGCGVRYRAGVGFEYYQGCYFEWGEDYTLTGLVLNGDTTGIIHSDEFIISLLVSENGAQTSVIIAPNPASDFILLSSSIPGTTCSITDLQGRTILQHRIISTNERMDVQALPPGMYVLMMDGIRPQRFVIAR